MKHFVTRRGAARFVFIIGCMLMILGSTFLIRPLQSNISRIVIISSLLMIFLGISCAVLATKLNRRSLYMFFAMLFFQTGVFLFLYTMFNFIPFALSQIWPLLSLFAGIALLTAGWHRYRKVKINYFVPSITFIILGVVLLIFSLNLVPFTLARFVRNWWPLLLVLAGMTLVLLSVGTRQVPKK
ncbi:MAG: DUF5668 domain-containing protein [Treponema sp.]|nr:DUF5668 domain-containing protein [Treponema sp.]